MAKKPTAHQARMEHIKKKYGKKGVESNTNDPAKKGGIKGGVSSNLKTSK
jgi:hypothetical protein